MRSGLFFLSVGLLVVGAKLPRTSGQSISDAAPTPITFACRITGLDPLAWLSNDEEVASSFYSYSDPLQDGETPQKFLQYSELNISVGEWNPKAFFTCVMGPKGRPPLTVQKTTDEDTGNPSATVKPIFEPDFQDAESESKMSMTCIVEGKRPPGISIVWQENGSPLSQGTYDIHNSSKDPYLMYSKLILHKTLRSHKGKTCSCTIGPQGPEVQKTQETTLVANEGYPHLKV